MCYMMDVHIFERQMGGRRYRVAAQSVWDSARGRSVARQAVLGPADPAPKADLGETRTIGTRAVGDVGALLWVAEQLDLVGHIDRACAGHEVKDGPSVGEMVLAVALQRVCEPGPKRDLSEFLDASVPRASCLPASRFTGQAFHRIAQHVTEAELESAQVALAKAAVGRFNETVPPGPTATPFGSVFGMSDMPVATSTPFVLPTYTPYPTYTPAPSYELSNHRFSFYDPAIGKDKPEIAQINCDQWNYTTLTCDSPLRNGERWQDNYFISAACPYELYIAAAQFEIVSPEWLPLQREPAGPLPDADLCRLPRPLGRTRHPAHPRRPLGPRRSRPDHRSHCGQRHGRGGTVHVSDPVQQYIVDLANAAAATRSWRWGSHRGRRSTCNGWAGPVPHGLGRQFSSFPTTSRPWPVRS